MLRFRTHHDVVSRRRRRAILRAGFLGAVGLAATEITALVAPFIRVNRILGLGNPVAVGTKAQVLEVFSATNDRPILFRQGRFFLLHAPGGIIAAYRKCTHLGCAVPWNDAEDRFHCPCHGSQYDKHTAVVVDRRHLVLRLRFGPRLPGLLLLLAVGRRLRVLLLAAGFAPRDRPVGAESVLEGLASHRSVLVGPPDRLAAYAIGFHERPPSLARYFACSASEGPHSVSPNCFAA